MATGAVVMWGEYNKGTSPWPRRRKRADENELLLHEKVILRRVASGERVPVIARDLGYKPGAVHTILYNLRKHHGVVSNQELLDIPVVREQLWPDGAVSEAEPPEDSP